MGATADPPRPAPTGARWRAGRRRDADTPKVRQIGSTPKRARCPAFVELKPGATVTEDDLIDFCVGEISTSKIPRYVRVVDEWPMSGTKVKKLVLRDRIAAEMSERGVHEARRISTRR